MSDSRGASIASSLNRARGPNDVDGDSILLTCRILRRRFRRESQPFLQFRVRTFSVPSPILDFRRPRRSITHIAVAFLHRDIKPANLLVDESGNLLIADFGLARIGSDAGMTMTGDILGTLRYMSPEQALAKRVVVDHRTDIYSLGITLYELLTIAAGSPGPRPPRDATADCFRRTLSPEAD